MKGLPIAPRRVARASLRAVALLSLVVALGCHRGQERKGALTGSEYDNIVRLTVQNNDFKDCDIYFIQDGKYIVDVVWYRVKVDGFSDRDFLEVEVHEAPVGSSIATLNRWKKWLKTEFGITDTDIVNDSLYEIYSGKKYNMAARR